MKDIRVHVCADVPHRKVYEPEKAVLDGLWSHPQAAQVVHFQHPQHPRPLPKLAGHTLLLPLTHKLLADCDPHISAKTYQLLHCMAVHARDQGREVQVIRDSLHVESATNSAISNAGLAYSVYTAIFASLFAEVLLAVPMFMSTWCEEHLPGGCLL